MPSGETGTMLPKSSPTPSQSSTARRATAFAMASARSSWLAISGTASMAGSALAETVSAVARGPIMSLSLPNGRCATDCTPNRISALPWGCLVASVGSAVTVSGWHQMIWESQESGRPTMFRQRMRTRFLVGKPGVERRAGHGFVVFPSGWHRQNKTGTLQIGKQRRTTSCVAGPKEISFGSPYGLSNIRSEPSPKGGPRRRLAQKIRQRVW